jgi:hypothetical protein
MSNNNRIIQTLFGGAVGQLASAKVNIFAVSFETREDDDYPIYKSVLPTARIKNSHWGHKIPAATPRSHGIQASLLGQVGEWSQVSYTDVPDDTLFAVQVTCQRRLSTYAEGILFCRARAAGPLHLVRAKLFPIELFGFASAFAVDNFMDDDGQYTVTPIQGRFDILPLQEIENLYGDQVHYPPQFKHRFFNADELAEIFEVQQLAPELHRHTKPESVVSSSGRRIILKAPAQNRTIKLPIKRKQESRK